MHLFLCFGSDSEGDSLALDVCDSLRGKFDGADFLKCTNPFEIANQIKNKGGREVVIIDAVKGLEKARIFAGADAFARTRSVTAHDLDLCTVLKLMEATEKKKFRIIGLPSGMKKSDAVREAERIIAGL